MIFQFLGEWVPIGGRNRVPPPPQTSQQLQQQVSQQQNVQNSQYQVKPMKICRFCLLKVLTWGHQYSWI